VTRSATLADRVLAVDLSNERQDGAATASLTGMGGSIAFVLAASVRAHSPASPSPTGSSQDSRAW
jgi:hypothetical protein